MKQKYILPVIIILLLALIPSCSTSEKAVPLNEDSDLKITKKYAREYGLQPPFASSYPRLFFKGEEVRNGMLELISRAEDYIILNTYLILNDEYGNIILEALKEKYEAGVNVYVIADSSSHFVGKESAFIYLHKHNIPFVEYNPIRFRKFLDPVKLIFRDHWKYWIIDGKYVLIGGCNIMNTSLQPGSERGNTDGMVFVESPGAAEQLLDSFIKNWNKYSPYDIRKEYFKLPETEKFETNIILFNQDTSEKKPVMEFMVNRMFGYAEKEVWIIQPYTFVDEKILAYIREMEDRGVEVFIVLSELVNHEKYHYASFYGIKEIIDAGADVYIYENSPLHYKAFIIDNRFFSIGSANFNKRSLELSDEANILFYDKKSFYIMNRSLDEIRKNLRHVTYEEALRYKSREYRWWHRMMKYTG